MQMFARKAESNTAMSEAQLSPTDLVLVTLELGWLPVPCEILEVADSSTYHEPGDILVQPLLTLTGISTDITPRWVWSFNCRKLDARTALQVVQASNELLAAVPALVLDRTQH